MDGMPKDVIYSGDWILRPNVKGTVEIAMYQGTAKKVKIPDQIDGKLVTRIGDKAFYECEIEEVEMPDSITEIGASTFSKCTSLEKIKFSENLVSIGNYAFAETKILGREFTLPNSVKTIGNFAFANCRRSCSFRFGVELEKVGLSLFSGTYLNKIFLPNRPIDMRGVLNSRDAKCEPLEVDLGKHNDYFTYENGVLFNKERTIIFYATYIYKDTEDFVNCTEYTVPDGVKEIGPHAFDERYTLRTLSLPASIKSVGKDMLFSFKRIYDRISNPDAYAGDRSDARLKKLILRDQSINGLKTDVTVNIPIEGNQVLLEETRQYFKMNRDNTFFDFDAYDQSFVERKSRDDKIMMATCRIKAPLRLSEEYKSLYTQYLKKNAKEIALRAILDKEIDKYDDDGLNMPAKIIITDAQHKMRKERRIAEQESNIDLLCSIEAIEKSVVDELIGNAKVKNKEKIAQRLMDYRINVLRITKVVKTNLNSVAQFKKIWTFKDNSDGTLTINGYKGSDTELEIPGRIGNKIVSAIGEQAFDPWKNNSNRDITSITIPNSVNKIGRYAFSDCSSLQSVKMPEAMSVVEKGAFKKCRNLKSITIPEGISEIEMDSFYDCRSLQSITIPQSVTVINNDAFAYCNSLQSVTIREGVMHIGNGAFTYCKSLQNITIPEGVTSIGDYAFSWCSSLKSITIPDGVTEIGKSAFVGCCSLKSVTIPKGVAKIGESAFEDCTNLLNVTLPARKIEIGANAFKGILWKK